MSHKDQIVTPGYFSKMTSLPASENGFLKRVSEKETEDDIFYMYGSTATHVTEETEYVRKIRATLEKIQSQLFKDETNGKSTQEKVSPHIHQNGGGEGDGNSFGSRYRRIIDKLNDEDLQLVDVHGQNEDLQIKLEATREAGAGAIRDATRKLYESYSKKSEEQRQVHAEEKQKLQLSAAEREEQFRKSVEKLEEVAEKIQEKHGRILELENLMERMEAENAALVAKKHLLENELSRRMANPANKNSCVGIQNEVSTVHEQISHLQQLMTSHHQHLRALIQEIEDLKNHLKEQDDTISELTDRVNLLECQNKELKYKVSHWSSPSKLKVSKGTSMSDSTFGTLSPYYMLLKHKNSPGSS